MRVGVTREALARWATLLSVTDLPLILSPFRPMRGLQKMEAHLCGLSNMRIILPT